jgi:hypothetical protein
MGTAVGCICMTSEFANYRIHSTSLAPCVEVHRKHYRDYRKVILFHHEYLHTTTSIQRLLHVKGRRLSRAEYRTSHFGTRLYVTFETLLPVCADRAMYILQCGEDRQIFRWNGFHAGRTGSNSSGLISCMLHPVCDNCNRNPTGHLVRLIFSTPNCTKWNVPGVFYLVLASQTPLMVIVPRTIFSDVPLQCSYYSVKSVIRERG